MFGLPVLKAPPWFQGIFGIAGTDSPMGIRSAPESTEFSINSLTADAGRCITSPAAIWFATESGSTLIKSAIKNSDLGGKNTKMIFHRALFSASISL